MDLSIIIPVYNEEKKISQTIDTLYSYLRKNKIKVKEVIVTEDGSKDSTAEIVKSKMPKYKNLRLLSYTTNIGRGFALNESLANAKSDLVLYMDVDLATDLNHIKDAVKAIEDGADLATGSRYLDKTLIKRTFLRAFISKSLNILIKLILRSKLSDHQCGFKIFRKSKVLPLLKEVKDLRWFWDTEILVRGARSGLIIKEFPVKWHEGQATKVKVVRDSKRMFASILRLWRDL